MVAEWLFKVPIAHRGLHGGGIPENSVKAFLNAAENGYPVELDVQIAKNGEAVVFHDYTLDRMTGVSGRVCDFHSDFIKGLKLSGTDEQIPLLGDLFKIISGKTPLLIEIKTESETDRRTEDRVLELLEDYKGWFALKSFNPWGIKHCKEKRPDFVCGLLSDGFEVCQVPEKKKELIKSLVFGKNHFLDFVSYNVGLMPDGFTSSLNPDIPLIGWTVRNAHACERARTKVKNIIFEGFIPDIL